MPGIFNTGSRESVEDLKKRAWRESGMLVIDVDKDNLTAEQREILRMVGRRRYGLRRAEIDAKRQNNERAHALWSK